MKIASTFAVSSRYTSASMINVSTLLYYRLSSLSASFIPTYYIIVIHVCAEREQLWVAVKAYLIPEFQSCFNRSCRSLCSVVRECIETFRRFFTTRHKFLFERLSIGIVKPSWSVESKYILEYMCQLFLRFNCAFHQEVLSSCNLSILASRFRAQFPISNKQRKGEQKSWSAS